MPLMLPHLHISVCNLHISDILYSHGFPCSIQSPEKFHHYGALNWRNDKSAEIIIYIYMYICL